MASPTANPRALLKRHFQSIMSLAIRGASVAAGFAVTVLIGRLFGPEANGHYALITQTAMFLSVVAVGGIDLAVTRKFSAAVAQNVLIERRSLIKILGYSLLFAAILILALYNGGTPVMKLMFKGEVPQDAIPVLILIMISRTLTRLLGAVLRSQKAYIWGQCIEVLLIPSIVLVYIAIGLAPGVEQVLWMTALTGLLVGFAAFLHVPALQHQQAGRAACADARDIAGRAASVGRGDLPQHRGLVWPRHRFRHAWHLRGGAVSRCGAGCGHIDDHHDGAVQRVLAAVRRGPCGGQYEARRPSRGAGDRLSVIFCLPAAVLIFLFAGPVLRIFGPEFDQATTVLRIVIVGQAIYTMTGPSGLILAMTGHERTNLVQTIGSSALLLISAPLAARYGGLLGIAICMSAVVILRNLASIWSVRRLTGINVFAGTVREKVEPGA
jgi:O-antigen/teichoic acid export membrane protein